MDSNNTVLSANLHVVGDCDYGCQFCMDRCLTRKYMKPEGWTPILEYLKKIGVTKINLAGGEPTMYPFLEEIVDLIRSYGFTVSIVSNGSLIDSDFLKRFVGRISWIGLSVDSPDEEDEIRIGRHCEGVNHIEHVKEISKEAESLGYNIKLNITVTRDSWSKDFRPLIKEMNPKRIKAFRVLTLKNANDDVEDTWSITDDQFYAFIENHAGIEGMVFEDNNDVIDTYLMFDPLGRWMTDSNYTKSFLPFEQLIRDGLDSILDVKGYYARNAVYDWEV